MLYCLLLIDLTPNNSSNIALASKRSVFDLIGFSQIVCNFSHRISGFTSIKYLVGISCLFQLSCLFEQCSLQYLICSFDLYSLLDLTCLFEISSSFENSVWVLTSDLGEELEQNLFL